ncbi:helix-turn-helix domain-containing protein [Streptomyces albus]|uniref:Helix-turn-helix domain-containing protein n=1 Tax=Streptomyces albus (strain ATCC 21838 / DSM 41398 / FERM P-419 / JCM 4703 / NBRC 107858) TaxID=1081613 RepID=A0A0B5EVA4_STRA4|nr:helix-turn-helix domain-containing protein [Streptomyces albus]AOU80021.1 helix-turn-helix domain-containing protein [Streptomyces albus]
MNRLDRPQLADFLRRGRARLTPAAVGMEAGGRRRTPGLRREEVAQLAGMSVDYYIRLEQRRGPRPSRQLLTSLSRALRLTEEERDHLFHLAGEQPPRPGHTDLHVRPGLLLILDRLHDTPAQIVTDYGEVLAQNHMAAALTGDIKQRPAEDRNLVRHFFTDPEARQLIPEGDRADRARAHVACLRAVTAARPDDPGPGRLVAELRKKSEEFRRLWQSHEVAARHTAIKRFQHPMVGLLELDCEVLLSQGGNQQLIVHTARPGTESYEKLELLRVVGCQDMDADPLESPVPWGEEYAAYEDFEEDAGYDWVMAARSAVPELGEGAEGSGPTREHHEREQGKRGQRVPAQPEHRERRSHLAADG